MHEMEHPILTYEWVEYYPYIVLPTPIRLQLRGPQLPPRPREPERPQLPLPPARPQLPERPTRVMGKLQAALLTGAGVAALIALIVAEAPFFLILAAIAGVAIAASFLYESWTYKKRMQEYEKRMQSYPQEQRRYEERLALWREECDRINADYRQRIEEQESEYQNNVDQIIRDWENGLRFEPLNLRQPFLGQGARAGRYDGRLREALIRGMENLPNLLVEVLPEQASLEVPGFDFPFTPDIAIRVSSNNRTLLIDVENDEPWYQNNGQRVPHHAVDDHRQTRRDNFFAESGWIVVRFSERQVAMETEECVNFVCYLIQAVLMPGFRDPFLRLPNRHRRWYSHNALNEERSF